MPRAAGPGGLAIAAIVSLGSSAARMGRARARLQVFGPDSWIELARRFDRLRGQGRLLRVRDPRRMRPDGPLERVGQKTGAIQQLVTAEAGGTAWTLPLRIVFGR